MMSPRVDLEHLDRVGRRIAADVLAAVGPEEALAVLANATARVTVATIPAAHWRDARRVLARMYVTYCRAAYRA